MTAGYEPAEATLETKQGPARYYDLEAVEREGLGPVDRLPYTIRILLESALRHYDGDRIGDEHLAALADWQADDVADQELPFMPGRVLLQDYTGVPAIVDLAACRGALDRRGEDPESVNPQIRSDLVIDHSVQVDAYGDENAFQFNTDREFERNRERYEFLKWGRQAFSNFSVVPPETGIVHQVNLEYFGRTVMRTERADGEVVVHPDTLVGTDSHTTMINGLGVLGWGVGGIEAEACMLGEPISILVPEVVGFELSGTLREGATATDLVLTVTQMLREHGVVDRFVEFHGPGLDELSLADRATLANMSPEYGATAGFFPVDGQTLDYLHLTGRERDHVDLVEQYTKQNALWRRDDADIDYTSELSLDLGEVEPSVAGPKNPHEHISLGDLHEAFEKDCAELFDKPERTVARGVEHDGETFDLTDGDIVIAAITSCTNTSNPAVMIGAGLVARRAAERGLHAKPWVKTSLAPGSRVVTEYLERADLLSDLEDVGFYNVGYGCTTCIGNSGPLPDSVVDAIQHEDLVACSILSGNRNFEGRVSPHTRGNYLASPPLVVAYAIAGTVDIDIYNDPLGTDDEGEDVYLSDLWPSNREIRNLMKEYVRREEFVEKYEDVYEGPEAWEALDAGEGRVYDWDADSTYIQEPPFFVDMPREVPETESIEGARCLVRVGDNTTTDHISPAGAIPENSPAGRYLMERGVEPDEFNSYGARRGNDQVMTRGTFGNVRLDNELVPEVEGGYTKYLGPTDEPEGPGPELDYETDVEPEPGDQCFIYDAAVAYMKRDIPTVVLAGENYGMGSSRDWAAKGTLLLGVEAVIAASYERIHRSNLVCMGVLPLQFSEDEPRESLDLTGREVFDIEVPSDLSPGQLLPVRASDPESGETSEFSVRCRIDTDPELAYYRHGGILQKVLREMAAGER